MNARVLANQRGAMGILAVLVFSVILCGVFLTMQQRTSLEVKASKQKVRSQGGKDRGAGAITLVQSLIGNGQNSWIIGQKVVNNTRELWRTGAQASADWTGLTDKNGKSHYDRATFSFFPGFSEANGDPQVAYFDVTLCDAQSFTDADWSGLFQKAPRLPANCPRETSDRVIVVRATPGVALEYRAVTAMPGP